MSSGGSKHRFNCPTAPCRSGYRGTPQGSAVAPVLANLFMHYAFDTWLARNYPGVQFERYADDAVVHCATRGQAELVLAAIGTRMEQVGLRLHPAKTRIVCVPRAQEGGCDVGRKPRSIVLLCGR